MRRVIPLIATSLLSLIAAEPLFAQQRLFALVPGELIEIDPRLPSLGTVLGRFSFPDTLRTRDRVFPFLGGAYLAWAQDGQVSLLDTRSGAIQRLTPPGFAPEQLVGTDGNTRLVISGRTAAQHAGILVADAHAGSLRVLDLGAPHLVGAIAYAAASDVLFVAKARREISEFGFLRGADFFDINIISAGSGAVLKAIDVSPQDALRLYPNAAGTRLFVNGQTFDVITGALSATITVPVTEPDLVVDEGRHRLIFGGEQLQAFSLDSLNLIGTTELPPVPHIGLGVSPNYEVVGGDTDVSGQSATIFLARGRFFNVNFFNDCHNPQLAAIDADTGRARAIADVSAFLSSRFCSIDLIRITEPAPPPGFSAQASGHQVTLEWQAPMNATGYEIEAGSAPGLKNLATIKVNDTQLVVDSVPAGVYHLRVRATNTIGKSAPSQEVQIVIP